jgi:hypothetical protein
MPPLEVWIGGESTRVEPDATSVVFAEMAFGSNYDTIPEYALRLAIAFYHGPHRKHSSFVAWERIHAWAIGSGAQVTLADN